MQHVQRFVIPLDFVRPFRRWVFDKISMKPHHPYKISNKGIFFIFCEIVLNYVNFTAENAFSGKISNIKTIFDKKWNF